MATDAELAGFEGILQAFKRCNIKEGNDIEVHRLYKILKMVNPAFTDKEVEDIFDAAGLLHNGTVSWEDFVQWLFDGSLQAIAPRSRTPLVSGSPGPAVSSTASPAPAVTGSASLDPAAMATSASRATIAVSGVSQSADSAPAQPDANVDPKTQLDELLRDYPYLEATVFDRPHPLRYWLQRCRECLREGKHEEFENNLDLIKLGLESDRERAAAAFHRFDADGSGALDASEFRYMCAYLGWGEAEAQLLDFDKDGKVSLPEFQAFVGRMGGLQRLFEHRRRRVNVSRRDFCQLSGADVGSRVRAHFYMDGKKSSSWQEARVLAVNVSGCPDAPGKGVMLEFGFMNKDETVCWRARQVVPPRWIMSGVEDAMVAAALREVGLLRAEHSYWHSIFPESEMRSVARLVDCQRAALAHIRKQATLSHDKAMPKLRERFESLGWGEFELQAVLSWIQELAPVVIHVHLDTVGVFLEADEFYRSQFETKTSFGALDDGNNIRKNWEAELFGDCYQHAKPFERCKYGALNVTNDFRGVVSASQYGDSYVVLKDVRLRCTFASEDSGGMKGSRLGMLDKYAHVLKEYKDTELKEVVRVASAAMGSDEKPGNVNLSHWPQFLRGSSQDPTRQWTTVGYPNFAQTAGCFYFEVELENCKAAQVGVVSTSFVCTPGVESAAGVGDDEHGWAVDGEHAARWHAGRVLPWSMTWSSDAKVVVGVAVDFGERRISFSCNGQWDDQFVFTASDVPEGVALYPAASCQGRIAFIFGPNFRHTPPTSSPPRSFARWPGTEGGIFKVDIPRIGNSETLGIYKEAQIHGEVNLKRNVQRLVANSKYRTKPKTERSWALCAKQAGRCSGLYERVGVHGQAPLYRNKDGAVLYFHESRGHWIMNAVEEFEEGLFYASPSEHGIHEPPRLGWKVPQEHYGVVETAIFKAALARIGIASAVCDQLASRLAGHVKSGAEIVFRKAETTSFEDQWNTLEDPPMSAESAWEEVVVEAQNSCASKVGLSRAVAIESEHPYPPSAHTFSKEVFMEGVSGMSVFFSPQCVTFDNCANLTIQTGGLRKASAGPGARVEVTTPDSGTVRGTLVARAYEGLWKVKLDSSSLAEKYQASAFKPDGDYFALCHEEQKSVYVTYPGDIKLREELTGFILDRSQALMPIKIAGFLDAGSNSSSPSPAAGPAQSAGVKPGWFVDLKATLFGTSQELIAQLQGDGIGEPVEDLEGVFTHLDDVLARLTCLLDYSEVTLVFTNCCSARLLPEAFVRYTSEQRVGDEVPEFKVCDDGTVTVGALSHPGPAQRAGVRVGWQLSLQRTLAENSSLGISEESILADPTILLKWRDVTLVFELLDVTPTTIRSCYADNWEPLEIPGDHATFVFTTDGDGGSFPEKRWGFFAVVVPQDTEEVVEPSAEDKLWVFKPPETRPLDIRTEPELKSKRSTETILPGVVFEVSEEKEGADGITYLKLADGRGWAFDKIPSGLVLCARLAGPALGVHRLMKSWEDVTKSVRGLKEMPSVELDGWEERRLRNLCARHGWEFEWMTEDGERRRRAGERHVRVPLSKSLQANYGRPDEGRPDGYVVPTART